MGLKEDLEAAVDAALEQRRTEDSERRRFEDSWQRARKDVLLPALQTAAAVLKERLGSGRADLRDGSVVLHVAFEGERHTLTIQPDPQENRVHCSSTIEGDPGETFGVERLGAALRHKLLEFTSAAARGRWAKRSVYDDRGLA
jgi:hypothetical protein